MKISNFTSTLIFFLVFSFGFLSSCEEGLNEEKLGVSCDNQERRTKLFGTYIGDMSISNLGLGFGNFTMSLTPSTTDCLKVEFDNTQGWSEDFEGQLSKNRIIINSEKVVQRPSDRCNGSYGNTINITIASSGFIDIIQDKDPIELDFNSVTHTHLNMDGEVLCATTYIGKLVKQ